MFSQIQKDDINEGLRQKIKDYLGQNETIHIIHQQQIKFVRILIYFIIGSILTYIMILSFFINKVLYIMISIILVVPSALCFGRMWAWLIGNYSYIFTNLKIIILRKKGRIILINYKAISSIEQIRFYFKRIYDIIIKLNEDAPKYISGNTHLKEAYINIRGISKNNKLFEEINQLRKNRIINI